MKTVLAILFCGSLANASEVITPSSYTGARTVSYEAGDIVHLRVKRRFMTTVRIEGETIMRIEAADAEHWRADDIKNSGIFFVKADDHPAKTNTPTDLAAVTTTGNLYLFLLEEVDQQPDIAVTVQPASAMKRTADGPPKWIDAGQVHEIQVASDKAREDADRARAEAEKAKAKFEQDSADAGDKVRRDYPRQMDFHYVFDRDAAPFRISSVWSDSKFTYIRLNPEEVPALYSFADNKPVLLGANFSDNLYVIPRVLTEPFYLQIGKKRSMIRYQGQ